MNNNDQMFDQHGFGPFGAASAQREAQVLNENYETYYFHEVAYNHVALELNKYLVVGRRGTGKSSLLRYFSFQKDSDSFICVDLNTRSEYQRINQELLPVARNLDHSMRLEVPNIAKFWHHAVWAQLFAKFHDRHKDIRRAFHLIDNRENRTIRILRHVLGLVRRKLLTSGPFDPLGEMYTQMTSPIFKAAQKRILQDICPKSPILVRIDSLDQYPRDNDNALWVTGALIAASEEINAEYSGQGLHIRTVIPAEIFPKLCQKYVPNRRKNVRDGSVVRIYWDGEDLRRLLMWRYYLHLLEKGRKPTKSPRDYRNSERKIGSSLPHPMPKRINWWNSNSVNRTMWTKFVPHTVPNRHGRKEDTLHYVLRHTQLKPCHVIQIFNEIAKRSDDEGSYFHLRADLVQASVAAVEGHFVDDILNAHAAIYPEAPQVMMLLDSQPMMIAGDEVDDLLASRQLPSDVRPNAAKNIFVQLGMLGRVREVDVNRREILADFRYTMDNDFSITPGQKYAVHPMFCRRLNITDSEQYVVYPTDIHKTV